MGAIPHQTKDHDRPATADDARRRLLAGLPVTERRLELAAIGTLLEGGEGPAAGSATVGRLAALWQGVIPDLPPPTMVSPDGPARASRPRRGRGRRRVAWLGELVERTCPEPPVLFGRGLGGAVAPASAAAHGDRVDRLVLVGAPAWPRSPAPAFGLAMRRFAEEPTAGTRDGLFRQCFVDLDGLAGELGERWTAVADYALDRARTPAMGAAMGGLVPELVLPAIPPADLARIAVPTSLLGRQDRQVRWRWPGGQHPHGWPLQVTTGSRRPATEQPGGIPAALRRRAGTAARAGPDR